MCAPRWWPSGPSVGKRRYSRGPRQQCAQADQVVRRRGKGHDPVDEFATPVPQLPQPADRLHPSEDLLDQLPFLLTDGVPGMARGAVVDRAAFVFLCDVRCHRECANSRHKAGHVEALVAADRPPGGRPPSSSNAASRSAVPVAAVAQTLATSPCRLSSSTWPAYESFASLPWPFRASWASGSVVGGWGVF